MASILFGMLIIMAALAMFATAMPSFMDLSSILFSVLMILVLFPHIRLIYAARKTGKNGRMALGILLPIVNFAVIVYAQLFANGTLYKVYFPWYKNTPEIEALRVKLEPLIASMEYQQVVNAITLACILLTILCYGIAIAATPKGYKKKEQKQIHTGPGTLLMTMYPTASHQYKYKELKVFRRPDGSVYYTMDDNYPHEGTAWAFAKEVKRTTSGGAQLRTGLGNIEVRDANLERVVLSQEAQRIHAADPLYQKYVKLGQIACEKNVQFSDAALSAYAGMNHRQREKFASLYAYDYQLDIKDCSNITTLLNRITEGVTPEQAAATEARSKRVQIVFWAIVGVLAAAYFLWYYFY